MTDDLSSPFSHIFSLFEMNSADVIDLARHAHVDPSYSFSNADLKDFDFSRKDLEGYDFSHADLTGCNFTGASVFMADFSSAIVDLAAIRAAEHGDCAIWPDDIFAGLEASSNEGTIQRTIRLAKGLHDRFSGPRGLIDGPLEIADRIYEDPIYDLAITLDTVGARLPPALYFYAVYLLARPVDHTVGFKSDVEWNWKTAAPRFVQGAIWMNEHRLTSAVAYGREPPDPGIFDLGSFFWREKSQARRFQIDYETLHGNVDAARALLSNWRAEAQLRDEPWMLVTAEVDQALLDVIEGAPDSRFSHLLAELKRHVSEGLFEMAVRHVVWSIYLASIYLQSPSLRLTLEGLMATYDDLFWDDQADISETAVENLEICPGFWELKRIPSAQREDPLPEDGAGEE